jgi:hypothetical protein
MLSPLLERPAPQGHCHLPQHGWTLRSQQAPVPNAEAFNILCKPLYQTLNSIAVRAFRGRPAIQDGEPSSPRWRAKGIGVRVLAALAGQIAATQAYIDVNDELKRAAVELAT